MPATVVFDTNILFSATGWRGNPFHCVELARSGSIRAITCSQIVSEFSEKLATKLAFSAQQVDETLADFMSFLQVVDIPGILRVVLRDPEDDAVLECAQIGRAQFVVTGDQDLLTLGSFVGIAIMSAAEFRRRWQAGEIGP